MPIKSTARLFVLLILLAMGLLLNGCGAPASDGPVHQKAEQIMRAFHESDVEKITSFYEEPFYKSRSPGQWKQELETLFNTFGKTINISMRNKTSDTRFSGKFYIYQFDTVHSNKKRAKHILTIIRPVNEPEQIVVVGHLIKTK